MTVKVFEAHLLRDEIETIMRQQKAVWEDSHQDAQEALLDTCHALANSMGLRDAHKEQFMASCGWQRVWG